MRNCFICKEDVNEDQFNYTCRCIGHIHRCVCLDCSKDKKYNEIREIFGWNHYFDIRVVNPQDVIDEKLRKKERELDENTWIEKWIKPNVNDGVLNLEHFVGDLERAGLLDEKWYKRSDFSRINDIYHRIKTPIDTRLVIRTGGNILLDKMLDANKSFDLLFYMSYCNYNQFFITFNPPIEEFEFQRINRVHNAIDREITTLVPLERTHPYFMSVPSNKFLYAEHAVFLK